MTLTREEGLNRISARGRFEGAQRLLGIALGVRPRWFAAEPTSAQRNVQALALALMALDSRDPAIAMLLGALQLSWVVDFPVLPSLDPAVVLLGSSAWSWLRDPRARPRDRVLLMRRISDEMTARVLKALAEKTGDVEGDGRPFGRCFCGALLVERDRVRADGWCTDCRDGFLAADDEDALEPEQPVTTEGANHAS